MWSTEAGRIKKKREGKIFTISILIFRIVRISLNFDDKENFNKMAKREAQQREQEEFLKANKFLFYRKYFPRDEKPGKTCLHAWNLK